MIPIGDTPEERRRSFPVVTLLLIVVNIAVFAYELNMGPQLTQFVRSFGMVPAEITAGHDLWPPSPSPVYLTLVSATFLHAGFLHIGGNMLFLWVFGDNVEDTLGHLPFLAFYLLCGIAGNVAQILVDPTSLIPSIGASGAIAGVLGGYLLLFPGASIRTLLFVGPFITLTRISAVFMIGIWLLFQLVSGLVELSSTNAGGSEVAFWAHIGGFAAGLIVVGGWRALRRLPSGTAGG